jgi:hypothetical protein
MMKFAAFENVVNALYQHVVPKPKSECNKTEQLGVSFAAGYIAGKLPFLCDPFLPTLSSISDVLWPKRCSTAVSH